MMISIGKERLRPEQHAELIRMLAGQDGTASGGGSLPLPDAFRAVTELLIERGVPVPEAEIVTAVRNAGAIPLRERRIISIWGSWEEFTRALLAVLKQETLAVYHSGHAGTRMDEVTWTIHSNFRTGKYYPVIIIPERDLEIGFTAHSPLEKEKASRKDGHLTSLRKLKAEIDADGMLLADIGDLFERIVGRLEGKLSPPRGRGRPSVGSPTPLPDEPGHFVMCTKGGEDQELVSDNFTQYRSRGKWYWNRECVQHAGAGSRNKGLNTGLRKQQVLEAVSILSVNGQPPSARSVARYLEQDDDRQVRKYWDELAAEGRAPRRQVK
jgi:hypothetical protein